MRNERLSTGVPCLQHLTSPPIEPKRRGATAITRTCRTASKERNSPFPENLFIERKLKSESPSGVLFLVILFSALVKIFLAQRHHNPLTVLTTICCSCSVYSICPCTLQLVPYNRKALHYTGRCGFSSLHLGPITITLTPPDPSPNPNPNFDPGTST